MEFRGVLIWVLGIFGSFVASITLVTPLIGGVAIDSVAAVTLGIFTAGICGLQIGDLFDGGVY